MRWVVVSLLLVTLWAPQLHSLVRAPSVGAPGEKKGGVVDCAKRLRDYYRVRPSVSKIRLVTAPSEVGDEMTYPSPSPAVAATVTIIAAAAAARAFKHPRALRRLPASPR